MKKKLAILLVTAGSIVAIAANGRENNNSNKGRNNSDNNRGNRMEQILDDATIITITGALELENGEFAKIQSNDVTYTIMAPWDQLMELEIKDGLKVTLEGAELSKPMQWDEKEKRIVLTKITINGKTTEINHEDHESTMGGKMSGRMNNHRDGDFKGRK